MTFWFHENVLCRTDKITVSIWNFLEVLQSRVRRTPWGARGWTWDPHDPPLVTAFPDAFVQLYIVPFIYCSLRIKMKDVLDFCFPSVSIYVLVQDSFEPYTKTCLEIGRAHV